MTVSKPDPRQAYRDLDTHRFAIGQVVKLKGGFGQPVLLPGVFRVTGLLPATEGQPQYRVRNDEERHERVAIQANIAPAGTHDTPATGTIVEGIYGLRPAAGASAAPKGRKKRA